MAVRQFPCGQCGAGVEFHPGDQSLKCPYCGAITPIPETDEGVEELDFEAALAQAESGAEEAEQTVLKCGGCGAEYSRDKDVVSVECPFCATTHVDEGGSRKTIKPLSLLPFKVTDKEAHNAFRDWINSRWFAPSDLKTKASRQGGINGMYMPYWTYDCNAATAYRGERGEHYYVTESYTTTDSNGKTVTKTRQVRKTRWYPASGTVRNTFDDVLVRASSSLPEKYAEELEPWDLENLTPYDSAYLAGFRAESYQADLREGFLLAQQKMRPTIRTTVKNDIGGDEQRIHHMSSSYSEITFKHILLPVWVSAYRYGEEVYRFLVNGRTGEVQGERPWSWVKITLAALAAIAAVAGLVAMFQG